MGFPPPSPAPHNCVLFSGEGKAAFTKRQERHSGSFCLPVPGQVTAPSLTPTSLPVSPDIRPCTAEEFSCLSGECIAREFFCDRRPDCRDMSDELDCGELLGPWGGFGLWVPFTARVCFSAVLLSLRPTEEPEPPECAPQEFACDSGECVPRALRCNGNPDCGDASDEDGCGECVTNLRMTESPVIPPLLSLPCEGGG